MIKKIKHVVLHVKDVTEAANFYSDVFGLKLVWRNEQEDTAGLVFPDTSAEMILYYDPLLAGRTEIHYLVDDVVFAVQRYTEQGCTIVTQPFDTRTGKCAVIADPFGIQLILLDMSRIVSEPA